MTTARVVVIGPGRLGLSLAAEIFSAGAFAVTVAGRRSERPTFLADYPEIAYVGADARGELLRSLCDSSTGAPGPTDGAHLIFSVPDDALRGAVEEWALDCDPGAAPDTVLHTSGVDSAAVLEPFASLGAATATWHPLIAIAAPRRAAFEGVWFGIDGASRARRFGERLAEQLGGRAMAVSPENRPQYHAAAVFASNLLLGCLKTALDVLRTASDEAELAALLPLARAALQNVVERGLEAGATGPLTRGDVQSVRAHLRVLDPETANLYRALSRELLTLAGRRLDPDTRDQLAELLEDPLPANGDRT